MLDFVRIYPDKGYHWVLKWIYYITPNLEKLNLKMNVVEHIDLPPHAVLYGLIYGVAYILILLIISAVVFEKKDLK